MAGRQQFAGAQHVPGKDDVSGRDRGRCRTGVHGLALTLLVEVHGRSAFTGAVVPAGVDAHAQDAAQFLGAEGKERLEGDGAVGAQLQAGVEDGSRTVHVFLGHLPGLHVGNVFVADACDIHGFLEGLAEVEGLDVFLQGLAAGLHGSKGFGVNGLGLQVLGNLPAKVLLGEHHGAVHEVSEDGHQFAVVAPLEVFPGKVVVLGLGGVGGEHVPQHILLSGELLLIFVHPHGPVAGCGNLVSLQVEELVGRHIVRQHIVSVGLEHGREHNAVEHDVVLADEVHQPGLGVFPPLLPALGKKFLGVGDIADGGVKPHVEHLALGTLYRNGNAPVQVTGDGAGLQAAVQPALALAVHVGLPLLVLLQDPVTQPGLVLVQGQIPVLGLLLHGRGARQFGFGVQQFLGAQGAAALLALVSVGVRVAAFGAGALDETVGEEHLGLLVIELLALLGHEVVLVVELAEELGRILLMHGRRRTGVDVIVDAEAREGVFHYLMILVHDVLRGNALLAGLDGDGHAVLVGAADEHHVLPAHAQVADIDVSGNVSAGQVADMDRTVGIGQCAGHKGSLITHFFSLPSFLLMFFLISVSLPSSCMNLITSSGELGSLSLRVSSFCLAVTRLSWNTRMARGT